ncbi:SusC/RagA family TonB-linked outer membrane protein [Niabella sp.]|uniref:SusC/RagA family TonB-linked outer membrane protein n=1 Tax=Niabella sp. TaxID=1962976 RepID=UPI002610A5A7|nr:SusC/RagA family TonB-linked outer membrane protein [Niabella sp.]
MKMKLLVQSLLGFALLLAFFPAVAQTKAVTGLVTDDKNQPVAGATIEVKGMQTATISREDGTFSLNVPANAKTLQVSYVGYTRQEVAITGGTIQVSLQPSTDQSLNEVVVIGYGTARKKDLTGSVASISAKDFNKGVITSPDQLIQGKTPGVMVLNNTGQPGGSATVRIRGNSSIRASNNPLFVLDGIPLSGTSARPGGTSGYSTDQGNPLTYLNPNDIASMDILKDASATAIYGSRGANGVVIITTKRGKSGAPVLNVNAASGIANILKRPTVLSADAFRDALKFYTPESAASSDFGASINPFNAITRTGLSQNYSADITGGTENGRYRISGGYFNQKGILKSSDLKKYTASFSSSFKLLESKKLGLDFNILVTQTDENLAPIDVTVGAGGNLISQALQWNPTRPMRGNGDSLTYVSTTIMNPLAILKAYKDQATVNTIVASVAPSYKITNDLEYKFIYSVTRQIGRRNGRFNAGLLNPGNVNNGAAFINNNTETDQQMTHTLSYNKQVTTDLNINAVAGYEFLDYETKWNNASGLGFTDIGLDFFDYLNYSTASGREINSYHTPTNQLQSYFLRGSFNYKDKYLLTITGRRDGSTKFGTNNKYGTFPALALAWNMSNEAFLKGNTTINNLKLRAGWGRTGNQEFPSGASRDRFTFTSQTITQVNFKNPDLKWETSSTLNAGIDFGLFDNRVSGSVDVFDKKTKDALFERTLAGMAPAGRIWVNLDGEVENKGIELALSGDLVRNSTITWNLGVNATFLKNNVTGLPGYYETGALRGQGFSGVLGQRMVNNQPLNVWYLAKFAGIDPSTGMSMYESLNGTAASNVDPAINKFYLGSPNPTKLLGLSTLFTYKKFSASVNMNGAFGHYLFNNTLATVLGMNNLPTRNISSDLFNKSIKESTSNSAAPSNRYLEKGNYLKLSNATLRYNIGNIGSTIRNLSISLTGQNLLVFTKYRGFDPEVNTDGAVNGVPSLGIEYLPYPPARSFLLGVNFSL